jgi:NitT/TauT family transport system substrate-binding protein
MDRRAFVRQALAAPILGLMPGRARAQAAATKLTLLVGTAPPDPACHFFYWAREAGFYRQHGLDVEIMPIAAETTALRALIAGEGDVAWVGAISTLQAMNAGSKVRIMSAFTPKLDYLVVAQSDIKNLKEMEGRSCAVSQVGAVSHMVPQMMIEAAGGDPTKVQWLAVGGSAARVQAVIAKRVDAAPLTSSFVVRTDTYKHLHVIGDATKDLPNFIYGWEVVAAEAIQKKRAALIEFEIATSQGVQWAIEHPAEAMAISRKLLPDVPAEELKAAVEGFIRKKFFNPGGRVPKEAWDFTVASMRKLGTIKDTITYTDGVLPEFADAIAAKLGGK